MTQLRIEERENEIKSHVSILILQERRQGYRCFLKKKKISLFFGINYHKVDEGNYLLFSFVGIFTNLTESLKLNNIVGDVSSAAVEISQRDALALHKSK